MFGPRKAMGAEARAGLHLVKTTGWPHPIALGVGAIVGTGIQPLTGFAAERAGPAVIPAFAIVGAVRARAALAYAERADAGTLAIHFAYSRRGNLLRRSPAA